MSRADETYCFEIVAVNRPRVLVRIVVEVAGREINIDALSAVTGFAPGRALIRLECSCDGRTAEGIAKAIGRLIDVVRVTARPVVSAERQDRLSNSQ